jgi:hypothetical protein
VTDIDTALGLAEHRLEMLRERREVLSILIAEAEIEIKGLHMAIDRQAVLIDGHGEANVSAEYVPTPLEERMAAAIIFMPEIGHLTAGVTREVIARCARVAVEFGAQSDGDAS